MRSGLALAVAFVAGFGLCWILFASDRPAVPAPDQVEGLTVMEPKRPDAPRAPVFLKVKHTVDASNPGNFPDVYARRNEFWQVHLTAGDRTIILLAEPVELPIRPVQ